MTRLQKSPTHFTTLFRSYSRGESDLEILTDFFSRRWFDRLWTLQEFVLARDVRVTLGDGYPDFALIKQATTLLFGRGGFNLPLYYGHSHSAGYAVVQQNTRRKFVEDTGRLISHDPALATQEVQMPDYETVLAWVFWRSAATFATDPRDYVYGIIGVADTIMERLAQTMGCHNDSRKGNIVSHCAPAYTPIKPDYSVDTARVFREFIAHLMHSSLGIRARGRSVSSVTLDSQLVKDARTAGNIHSRQEGGINLLSLGPATLKGGDEAWALHGSK